MFSYVHCLSDVDVTYCICYRRFLQKKDLVELRLDLLDFDVEDLKVYFRQTKGLATIVTYRMTEDQSEEMFAEELSDAVQLLSAAVMAGAAYIDISDDFPEKERDWLITLSLNYHCGLIVSHHNYYGVQPLSELKAAASRCFALGADLVTIATTARHPEEAGSVLKLYDYFPPEKLVAFAMGTYGRLSRIEAVEKGCRLYYVSPRQSRLITEGEPTFFDILDLDQKHFIGEVKAPCSAGYAVRAIIAAALCEGDSRIRQVGLSLDVTAAMNVARQLGAEAHYTKRTRTISIKGVQKNIAAEGLIVPGGELNAGESTLVAEICLAIATLSREPVTVTGEKGLLKRRFTGMFTPLIKRGVSMNYTRGHLPATVKGGLKGGIYSIDGTRHAGCEAGLLFVLPLLAGHSRVVIRKAVGIPGLRMTMNILERFGYSFTTEDFSGQDVVIGFDGGQKLRPARIRIEADWLGAALWTVMGVTVGESMVRRLPLETDQAGYLLLDVIDRAGGDIGYYASDKPGDNWGDFSAVRSVTFAFEFDLAEAPELIGPLMMLALRSEGTSVLTGISRLSGFDRERLANFVAAFINLGAKITVDDGRMEIIGSFDNKLQGGRVYCCGDPLLAMTLEAANLISDSEIEIVDATSVEKIWPGFRC